LIDKADELGIDALDGVASLGISSGASVPGYIVDDVVEKIKARFVVINIHASESPERKIKFSLPKI
jgi:4-hydroxy-3-methylbut-2-enyl diphosphate reductase IspH